MSEENIDSREDSFWENIYKMWESIPVATGNFIEITCGEDPKAYSRVTAVLSRNGHFIELHNVFDSPPRLIAQIRIDHIKSVRPLLDQKNTQMRKPQPPILM